MIFAAFSLFLRVLYKCFSNTKSLLLALNMALLCGFVKIPPS